MDAIYLNDWKTSGLDGMLDDFGITEATLDGAEVLIASYTYEDYSGSAFVLLRKDGKLFEVNGSHCSCHGLSEQDYYGNGKSQWETEETTVEAIRHRLERGHGFDGANDKIREVLDAISRKDAP